MIAIENITALADARIAYEAARGMLVFGDATVGVIDQSLPTAALRDAASAVGAHIKRESVAGLSFMSFDWHGIHWYAASGEVN